MSVGWAGEHHREAHQGRAGARDDRPQGDVAVQRGEVRTLGRGHDPAVGAADRGEIEVGQLALGPPLAVLLRERNDELVGVRVGPAQCAALGTRCDQRHRADGGVQRVGQGEVG